MNLSMSPENFNPPALRLHQILASFSSSPAESASELVDFINSITDSIASDPENEEFHDTAFQVLSEIRTYLSSPSLDQEVMDELSFKLPEALARVSSVSKRCTDVSDSIINRFIATCSPRDMLSFLCNALGSPGTTYKAPGYYSLIFGGLAKVLLAIERRQFVHVKATVPIIFNVLKAMSLETNNEDAGVEDLFNKTVDLANSIQAVCVKLEGKDNEKICALFGLTVLEIMALTSISMGHDVSKCLPLVEQLSLCLQYCHLSYLGLITGCDIDKNINIVLEGRDDEDDYFSCFSYVNHGAALAVIWGEMFHEVSVAAEVDLTKVKDELRSTQTKRWLAVGMLKHLFSCVNLPWELKKHAINFLHVIMEGKVDNSHDEHIDDSVYMPSLCAALQAVQVVIIYASDRVLRKKAFDAFKMVLADIPANPRFDILFDLIKKSGSSSMIAILLDCVRDEMHKENRQRISNRNGVQEEKDIVSQNTQFWSAGVLELVEFVLRPPEGGPPILPEYSDAALSALNLYRYILITESTGKTNYTGIISKANLEKSYKEWLLPLRTLVTAIVAENQKDDNDEVGFEAVCALNPVELVLYHCIELVEGNMKQSS